MSSKPFRKTTSLYRRVLSTSLVETTRVDIFPGREIRGTRSENVQSSQWSLFRFLRKNKALSRRNSLHYNPIVMQWVPIQLFRTHVWLFLFLFTLLFKEKWASSGRKVTILRGVSFNSFLILFAKSRFIAEC